VRPKLVRGGKGVFDVKVDGTLVFSKYEQGRFPEHREVLEKLPERL
jgi:selenoprotein W-related protein